LIVSLYYPYHLTPTSLSWQKRKPLHRGLPLFFFTSNFFPLQATHLPPLVN
jgi:hypothetical protein